MQIAGVYRAACRGGLRAALAAGVVLMLPGAAAAGMAVCATDAGDIVLETSGAAGYGLQWYDSAGRKGRQWPLPGPVQSMCPVDGGRVLVVWQTEVEGDFVTPRPTSAGFVSAASGEIRPLEVAGKGTVVQAAGSAALKTVALYVREPVTHPDDALEAKGFVLVIGPTGEVLHEKALAADTFVDSMAWSPDGGLLAVALHTLEFRGEEAFRQREVRLYDAALKDWGIIQASLHPEAAPAWAPDGERLAVSLGEGTEIGIMNVHGKVAPRRLRTGVAGYIKELCWTEGGLTAAVAAAGAEPWRVLGADADAQEIRYELRLAGGDVPTLCGDGRVVVRGGDGGVVVHHPPAVLAE